MRGTILSMKDKKIIIGNWKMAPKTLQEAKATFQNIKSIAGKMKNVTTVVCAPHVYTSELAKLSGGKVLVGVQTVSYEIDDPHTGEVSADMVKDAGASYVIVGHSECRAKGETSEDVAKKVAAVTKKGLTAVVCVGESERDEEGAYTGFVKKQLVASLAGVPKKSVGKIIVAYEPVWAIGVQAKREATPEDVLEMSIFIRKVLADMFGSKESSTIPLLYGGSVDQKNAFSYLSGCEVQGLLVGRVSLKPGVFEKILQVANG